jgi:hypothetical protein
MTIEASARTVVSPRIYILSRCVRVSARNDLALDVVGAEADRLGLPHA